MPVDHLTPEQVQALRERLDQERAQLVTRLEAAVGVRDEEEVEQQDAAAIEDGRQREIRLAKHDERRLAAVQAALGRFEDGSYGICEETGEPIPFRRLEIEPTTRYTVEAAESLELGGDEGPGPRDDPGAY